MKHNKITSYWLILTIRFACILFFFGAQTPGIAQIKTSLIRATNEKVLIADGENLKMDWKLNPQVKPDIYYVNIPSRKSRVILTTDQDEISFETKPGENYDVIVLLNERDSCHIRISSVHSPTSVVMEPQVAFPKSVPFTLIGSRIYFKGDLNGKPVNIQLDLGAGINVINKSALDKLDLKFSKSTLVSNTDGVNEARTSINNGLKIGSLNWSGVVVTEVGNMQPYEDMIIGNGLFRDKIIEIDYERMEFTIYDKLPAKAKFYAKQPVYFEQDRPKFKAEFVQNGNTYSFWFLFDTGRDGSMLIGEDFTGINDHWEKLNELRMIKGRKIVRLDAIIAGQKIKDVVTNAANPDNPQGRPSLFGNQILNHFNVILDNKNGVLYLKSNNRKDESYSDYKSYLNEAAKMQKE